MERPRRVDESVLLAQRGWMRRLAAELVSDAHAAEDLVQEAFSVALERPPRTSRLPVLRRWLRVVLENAVRREGNARSARRWHEDRAAGERRGAVPDVDTRLELESRLTQALRDLAQPYREAVVLRYVDGLAMAELAQRAGVTEVNARQRVSRGLAQLRRRLDQDGGSKWRPVWVAWLGEEAALPLGAVWMSSKVKLALAGVALIGALLWWGPWAGALRSPQLPAPQPITDVDLATGPEEVEELHEPAGDARQEAQQQEWAVDRERDLHGVVIDPLGQPVEGAEVSVHGSSVSRTLIQWTALDFSIRPVEGSTRTDSRGRFAVRLKPGPLHDVQVLADGFAPTWSLERQAGERVVIQLSPPGKITGRVAFESGQVVPGVRVVVGPVRAFHTAPAFALQETRTALDGSFAFAGLPAGSMALFVESDQGSTPDGVSVRSRPGETVHVEVPIFHARSVRGRVVDAESRLPVADALVQPRLPGLYGAGARTRPDGNYELVQVHAHAVYGIQGGSSPSLLISAPGYVTQRHPLKLLPPDSPTETVDVELVRGCALRGRVVDLQGTPVAGAQVALTARRSTGRSARDASQDWDLRTDEDGVFVAEGLAREWRLRNREHALLVTAPGYARIARAITLPKEVSEVFDMGDVMVTPPGVVKGLIRDPAGEPVPGANVTVVFHNDGGPPPDGLVVHRVAQFSLTADDLGRFTAVDLPAGEIEIMASRMGIHRRATTTITLGVGEARVGVELTLPGGKSIAGTVRNLGGDPIAGATIYIRGGGGGASIETDENGAFEGRFLAPGLYSIIADHMATHGLDRPYINSGLQDIPAGARDVTLTLRRARPTDGVLLDGVGTPMARQKLEFVSEEYWRALSTYTDEAGEFEVALPEGLSFDIVLRSRAGARVEVPLASDVPAGTQDLSLRVPN